MCPLVATMALAGPAVQQPAAAISGSGLSTHTYQYHDSSSSESPGARAEWAAATSSIRSAVQCTSVPVAMDWGVLVSSLEALSAGQRTK